MDQNKIFIQINKQVKCAYLVVYIQYFDIDITNKILFDLIYNSIYECDWGFFLNQIIIKNLNNKKIKKIIIQ